MNLQRLDFDLRVDHQREILSRRLDIYEELLAATDRAIDLTDWALASDLPDTVGPLTNIEIDNFKAPLKKLGYRVQVSCSSELRHAARQFLVACASVDETMAGPVWTNLKSTAVSLQAAAVENAVIDRTSGLATDGLGGM